MCRKCFWNIWVIAFFHPSFVGVVFLKCASAIGVEFYSFNPWKIISHTIYLFCTEANVPNFPYFSIHIISLLVLKLNLCISSFIMFVLVVLIFYKFPISLKMLNVDLRMVYFMYAHWIIAMCQTTIPSQNSNIQGTTK